MQTESITMKTETIFSDDRRHRYLLRKEWDASKTSAAIIMTNASTADLLTLDYTTLYILNNLAKLEFGSVDIVNLVSKMTTKLNVKENIDSLSDEENINYILKSAERADRIIIAWGKLGENNKVVKQAQLKLLEQLRPFKDKLFVISDDRGNEGFHPLAPQIRFYWTLKKFVIPEPEVRKEEEQKATKAVKKSSRTEFISELRR